MTYQEASVMLNKHEPNFLSNRNFVKATHNCQFLNLLIAPAEFMGDATNLANLYYKIFDAGIKNDRALLDSDLFDKDLIVFFSYLSQGVNMIIPLEAHLKEPSN